MISVDSVARTKSRGHAFKFCNMYNVQIRAFFVPKFFLKDKLDIGQLSNATCNNSIHRRCLVNK